MDRKPKLTAVCAESLSSDVVAVKPAKDGV
jgi:hypothetical protein